MIRSLRRWFRRQRGAAMDDTKEQPAEKTAAEIATLELQADAAHEARKQAQARLQEAYGEFIAALSIEDNVRKAGNVLFPAKR